MTPDEVISGQAMPRLTVDAQGNISLVWYDTRRDPANHLLDVFGTTSTDGGLTFSPNFRVTDQSFDADQGKFKDATGQDDYDLGDYLGLALANNTAYAAWTDTHAGKQAIDFSRYTITRAPPNDRYEPNDTAATATDLGMVVIRTVPRLAVPPGDEDWFKVQAAATGDLVASATFADQTPTDGFRLELWDETGARLLTGAAPSLDTAGNVIRQDLRFPAGAGQTFLLRVRGAPADSNQAATSYSLYLQSLTADLGTRAYASVGGSIESAGGVLYRVAAAAAGSLAVEITSGEDIQGKPKLQILDPQTFAVLASGHPPGPSLTASSVEPNDAIGQANVTGLDGSGSVTIEGNIGGGEFGASSGDYDFYRFEATASQKISVTLDAASLASQLDSMLIVFDSTGKVLVSRDDTGKGGKESLTWVTDTAGSYYVAVLGWQSGIPADPFKAGTGARAGSTGLYRLSISGELVGPGAMQQAVLAVKKGDAILVQVSGDADTQGDYTLESSNLDQFTTSENASLVFPAGAGPSSVAVGDLNDDGTPDLVVADARSDTVSVLLGNGDGTFQAPRQFAIGAFRTPNPVGSQNSLANFRRKVVLGDFNHDGKTDIAVANYDSGDVSVLLGRGDGTFEPQRRFDATAAPFDLAAGDLNGDGVPDLVAIDSHAGTDSTVTVLLGRGDGTFRPQQTFPAQTGPGYPFSTVYLADLRRDGKTDLIVSGSNATKVTVFQGNGDGTFQPGVDYTAGRLGGGLAVADIDGDGTPDIITTSFVPMGVAVLLGKGDGTFTPLVNPNSNLPLFPVGQCPVAVTVADGGSQVTQPDGSVTLGPPDGHPDLIVASSGGFTASTAKGPMGIFLVPTLWDAQGNFAGLGVPQLLAPAKQPLDVTAADLTNDGVPDIIAVDQEGIRLVFGKRPHILPGDTPQTARELGTVVHVVEPTLTIVPGHERMPITASPCPPKGCRARATK